MVNWNSGNQGNRSWPTVQRTIPPLLVLRIAALACLAIVVLLGVFGSSYTIEQKELGVITEFGAYDGVAGPGFHLKLPFIQEVTRYHTATQSIGGENVETFTVDNQPVMVGYQVQYNVPPDQVESLFKHLPNYETRMQMLTTDRLKIAFGTRQIAEVPSQRGAIEQEVLHVVQEEGRRLYGLEVTEFQLIDLQYSKAFQEATDRMAVAKAKVAQAEQMRLEAQKNAERVQIDAQGQAMATIAEADGRAQSLTRVSQAEANATRIKGEAEADAIRAQAAALGASPNFVAYKQASQWDGKLPQTILGGQGALPILNIGH